MAAYLPSEKAAQLGINLTPREDMDNGHFVQVVRTGNLLYTSGQIPRWEGEEIKGKIGAELSLETGVRAAILCTYNCLRVIHTEVGSIDRVLRIIKILGMVNVAPGFSSTSEIIHGGSDLLREVFGDRGLHARSAVGMALPSNWAVEIEMIVEIVGEQ